MNLFLHIAKLHFCLMYGSICLLHRFIQDFMEKALFSEVQAIRSG